MWVLTDSRMGNRKQALALAEAVKKKTSLKYEAKIVTPKASLQYVPNFLLPKNVFGCEEVLSPPYPKLIISCGRVAAQTALAIKQADSSVKLVQILNPSARVKHYDLVILPKHDRREYKNSLLISGALTDVTAKSLTTAKRKFSSRYGKLKKPVLGVLIGGNNKAYKFTPATINAISDSLQNWVAQGYNIIGTFSRRTPQEMQQRLLSMSSALPQVDFWNGEGDNPYAGILAHAHGFAVTSDSINMVSEAYHTGKPTYIIGLKQRNTGENKFTRFHDFQMLANRVRHASETLSFSWKPRACDDLARATEAVCKLL